MLDILKQLTLCYGPSGNEEIIRDYIINQVKFFADEIITDSMGNLIVRKKGNGKKIMLASHMDEVGVIITYIDKKGFLRFSNLGGVSAFYSLMKKVIFANGTVGTIGYEEKNIENFKNLNLSKMYIDIGATSKEEALKNINIGDTACFQGTFNISNNSIMTKSLDNRAGCYVLIEALKNIKSSPNDLYFVFTVQEELGLRGAKTSSYLLDPDYAISVDVTATGDTPESKTMAVELGKGPAIKIKDNSLITHPYVRELMIDAANENSIPYQLEVLEHGGTDSGAIHVNRGGIPSGVLSIPTRYIHSSSEVINKDDLQNSVKLLNNILTTKFN